MAKTKKYTADILIIGAGVAGLVLAKLLGDQNLCVHIVEPAPPAPLKDTPQSSRTVAMMQSSLNILKAAGLGEFCNNVGTKMEMMRIIDDSMPRQKSLMCEFDAFDLGLEYFGMNIPNSLMRAKLYEDCQSTASITMHENCKLTGYDIQNHALVHATIDNGATITAPLIVGADGRGSMVREISGIQTNKKQYDQSAITCIINHSRSHNNTSTEFHREGGPFALVPLQGNQSSVVWVEKSARADQIMKLPKDAFENALQSATNDILGGITLETTPQSWPLCAVKSARLTAPRTALIAEAAHVMSPITAQGLNLSLRDVAALSETIIDALRVGSDHGSKITLRTYEKRRSLDIETRFFGVNSLNQMVSNDHAPIKDLRRAGLKMVDRFSPLKTIAMQHGLAPTLDQGRLALGGTL